MAHPKFPVAGAGPIGGASGDAGVEYRRAVAAYAVAHGLAGEALPGFGFALSLAQVVGVAVETDEYADDVRVSFVGGCKAQVQAKRTLRFGSVLRKAVAQWNAAATAGLDPIGDRLVVMTGAASAKVRVLAQALDRCKTDEPGAFTGAEQEALRQLDDMLSELTALAAGDRAPMCRNHGPRRGRGAIVGCGTCTAAAGPSHWRHARGASLA